MNHKNKTKIIPRCLNIQIDFIVISKVELKLLIR